MTGGAESLRGGALWRVPNGPLQTNVYLLAAPGGIDPGSPCVVVDPGLDHALLEQLLQELGWLPQAVLCTHGHFDHVGGCAWLQARYGIPVYLPAADLRTAKLSNFMMAAFKMPGKVILPTFSLVQSDTPPIEAAGRCFDFRPLPGHTPGSSGILVDGLLFSGDALYARRTALSRLPGEDHDQLRASLLALFAWADDTLLVLPGHGGTATLGDIQLHNTALRAFMAEPVAASPVP
jgi:hydroxyacylglutathione hydrolase